MNDEDVPTRGPDRHTGVDRGRPAPLPRAGSVLRPTSGAGESTTTGRVSAAGPDDGRRRTDKNGAERTGSTGSGKAAGRSSATPGRPAKAGSAATTGTAAKSGKPAAGSRSSAGRGHGRGPKAGSTTGDGTTTAGSRDVAESSRSTRSGKTAAARRGAPAPEPAVARGRTPGDAEPTAAGKSADDAPLGARVIPLRADGAHRAQRDTEPTAAEAAEEPTGPGALEEAIERIAAFVRRRADGDYKVDEFGFDAELTDNVLIPALRPLYRSWFRVETIGMHHVPDVGGALVVANHSGTLPLDSLMTAVALHDDHPAQRHLRMLGADLIFKLPVLGPLMRKQGATLACNPDAERLMSSGELVGVWPEGFKGIGKPFKDRYKLQRFGRGGFVSAALRTGVPIIPCAIVGAEEIYPKIGDIKPLARLFGAPYFPVTPTFPLLGPLGAVPLPSKWYIEFGEPIRTDGYDPADADDPMLVFNMSDQVRESIQHTLYRLLSQRRNAFLG